MEPDEVEAVLACAASHLDRTAALLGGATGAHPSAGPAPARADASDGRPIVLFGAGGAVTAAVCDTTGLCQKERRTRGTPLRSEELPWVPVWGCIHAVSCHSTAGVVLWIVADEGSPCPGKGPDKRLNR